MRYLMLVHLCLSLHSFSQGTLVERLDQDLTRYMDIYKPAGLTVAVVVDGKLAYTKALGVKNKDTGDPMTLDAVFHAASVSKPFVATAVMHLVERGKLRLDEPVVTYLPYFKLDSHSYDHITIRDMLTHHSGMPDVEDYQWERPQLDEGAAERYVRSIAKEKPIGPRGAQFAYSNMAFDVLADVIHKVSGQLFEDYLKQHLLRPIGMKDSSFYYPDVSKALRTSPHEREDMILKVRKVYPYNRRHAPSSTLNTNVLDLARWGMMNLNRGRIDGKRILRKESFAELFKAQADANRDQKVGLSWFISDFKGHKLIGHSGLDPGYRAQFAMIPAKGIAVAVLCNADMTATEDVRNSLLAAALKLPREKIKQPIEQAIRSVYLEKGLKAAVEHYQKLKANPSEAYTFDIGQLYNLGYELSNAGRYKDALRFFQLNVEAYPEHTGAQGSLGEAYLKVGNRAKAIEHLKRAVEIDPKNQLRRNMLEKVLAEKL